MAFLGPAVLSLGIMKSFDNIPAPERGLTRQWVRCKACRRVAYYDYLPYSLGTPSMTLPCGHGSSQRFSDGVERITEAEARKELKP